MPSRKRHTKNEGEESGRHTVEGVQIHRMKTRTNKVPTAAPARGLRALPLQCPCLRDLTAADNQLVTLGGLRAPRLERLRVRRAIFMCHCSATVTVK